MYRKHSSYAAGLPYGTSVSHSVGQIPNKARSREHARPYEAGEVSDVGLSAGPALLCIIFLNLLYPLTRQNINKRTVARPRNLDYGELSVL
jgi:hypothetical protein